MFEIKKKKKREHTKELYNLGCLDIHRKIIISKKSSKCYNGDDDVVGLFLVVE